MKPHKTYKKHNPGKRGVIIRRIKIVDQTDSAYADSNRLIQYRQLVDPVLLIWFKSNIIIRFNVKKHTNRNSLIEYLVTNLPKKSTKEEELDKLIKIIGSYCSPYTLPTQLSFRYYKMANPDFSPDIEIFFNYSNKSILNNYLVSKLTKKNSKEKKLFELTKTADLSHPALINRNHLTFHRYLLMRKPQLSVWFRPDIKTCFFSIKDISCIHYYSNKNSLTEDVDINVFE